MAAHTTVAIGDVQTFTGVANESLVYRSDALRNIYHSSMWIEEIRFWAVPNGQIASGGVFLTTSDIFGGIQVEFSVHGYKMSAQPVVIDLLCTDFQTALEQENAPHAQAEYRESYRRWIPPKEILLPPGDTLSTRLVCPQGLTGFDIWVVAIGRISDDSAPDTAEVPYILQYAPLLGSVPAPLILSAGGLTQFTVPVFSLQNPLDRDLHIQRMISRLLTTQNMPGSRDRLREIPDLVQLDLTDSQGYQIAKSLDLGAFVDATRRAWTFRRALESHGYMKAQFTLNTSNANYAALNVYPELCLVGSRVELIR